MNGQIYELLRDNIKDLVPYSTARDDCKARMDIYLDANENPYWNGVNRYPSPHQLPLKKMISELKGIPVENIFLGNGSDEPIDLVYRMFCPPGRSSVVQIVPTYGMYGVAAAVNDVEVIDSPLTEDFSLVANDLLSKVREDTRVIFLCSPNNPSGNLLSRQEIIRILDSFKGIVVVDEAYIDFTSSESMVSLIHEYPGLVVLQTMSKAWGMAGLRVGLAIADEFTVSMMSRVKYPYNISVLNQEKAMEVLKDAILVRDRVGTIKSERRFLAERLAALPSVVKVFPSDANFLLVRFKDKDNVFNTLVSEGIIVRDRSSAYNCEDCLRITVGTPQENRRLLEVLGDTVSAPEPGDEGRSAYVVRSTKETDVRVRVNLDAFREPYVSTGLSFLDHMLEQIAYHGRISLDITCFGDLDVDDHHSVEDVAIALGDAILKALGDKSGIGRYGFCLPMDEADACVVMDLGGRIDFAWDVEFSGEKIGDVSSQMFRHFFKSLSEHLVCNLHIKARGENDHHIIEGVFKAFARALKCAIRKDETDGAVPSSKGWL